jgi:hypothetical protein
MSHRQVICVIFSLGLFLGICFLAMANPTHTDTENYHTLTLYEKNLKEWNNRIRREKFDIVLPEVMRKNNIDMWIHVMREKLPDPFGAEDLGSTSGVFIFTDRSGDRIERAILGRRWGASHRGRVDWDTKLVEECGAYDIIGDSVRVQQPVGGPETEYDYRFKGLKEFVEERDPKRIALNFKKELGPYPTTRARDGISHTDYLLLAEELGERYTERLVSSEYVMMDYIIRKVPSEIELLKKMRADEDELVLKAFEKIVPGVTKTREVGNTGNDEVDVVVFRRMWTGQSQRGRSDGWKNTVVQGGDIIAAPSQGMYAYVLREGESEPPPEIKKLWAEYLKINTILAETIQVGLTVREIKRNYTKKFEEAGIIVRDPQLHMVIPKNDFAAYSKGFDPEKTQLSIDCHGMGKGARKRKFENYFGPRIGSQGPEWTWDIPLPPNHHFVLEYFFYMPSPTVNPNEDQYLLWWDHEQAIATETGVECLSYLKKELFLIK